MDEWMSRAAALDVLKVKAQSLYAYVSRGRIEMRPDPADSRRSMYRAEDVTALATRRARGRQSAAIAASTINWGEPVIATSIATIHHGQLIYRGKDAVELAGQMTLEEAAALLWQADRPISFTGATPVPGSAFEAIAKVAANARLALGRSADRLQSDAAETISALALALGAECGDAPVHQRLAASWGLSGEAADRIRTATVLMADHELNASTFAVRVAASTGASLAASLLAGLCALSGPKHGNASAAMVALLREADQRGAALAVSDWLARHGQLPGFGHHLYPAGDPRAAAILHDLPADPPLEAVRDAAFEIVGTLPNLDYALAALIRAYGLPEDAGFRLFALGRSVGWAAHAMEQLAHGQIIRPRARYIGSGLV